MHLEKLRKIVVIWTIGLLLKLLLLFFIRIRLVRVTVYGYQKEKLDHQGRGQAIVYNHTSLWETFVLVLLFSPFKCLFSLKHVPYIFIDKIHFFNKWWFWLFRPFVVALAGDDRREGLKAFARARELLEKGNTLILPPEGGRTENWGRIRGFKYSPSGKRIAKFPLALRKLFQDLDCFLLLVWSEGGERVVPNTALPTRVVVAGRTISENKKMVVFFSRFPRAWRETKVFVGDSLELRYAPKEEIVEWMENALLDTAEQGGQK